MGEIRDRIIANIRANIKNFLRYEIPIPKRGAQWDDTTAKLLVEERELREKEIEAKHTADYESMNAKLKKAYDSSAGGMPYEEWLDKARRLYSIQGNSVTSIAKGPKNVVTVATNSPWQAKKRVLQLIAYKYNDHFNKGFDFMYDPDGETNEVSKED